MATITLNYDGRNAAARKMINDGLEMGWFTVQEGKVPKPPRFKRSVRKAINDAVAGNNLIHCGSFEEFKRHMSDV